MPVVNAFKLRIADTWWGRRGATVQLIPDPVSRLKVLAMLVFALLLVSVPEAVFSQGKKNSGKLHLVKAKSERNLRQKQRESSKFVGDGVKLPNLRQKQRESSRFVGNDAAVPQRSSNRVGNISDAKAYQRVGLPQRSRNPMGEQIARNSQAYQGNGRVASRYLKEKIARKNSRAMSGFRGDVLVKRQDAAGKSRQLSRYRGDILVKKMPKGAHPSSVYRGGKTKNSYQQKEKYRKRMMKRIGRNRDIQQPGFLRRKNRDEKPTYDSRESEIWSKPR